MTEDKKMSFDLYSRTVRIGGPDLAPGCGYRDIVIHEMTESEIEMLKTARWAFPSLAIIVGFMAGAIYMAVVLPHC